jgi:formylglycine-generating enzyme
MIRPMRGIALLGACLCTALAAAPAQYAAVPGGSFASVLPPDGKTANAVVAPFRMRVLPVSNAEFQRFAALRPQWQREHIAPIFADENYLAHWGTTALAQQPVTQVSWFAAQAYCQSEGARLPTWHEWEYVAAADARRRDARSDPVWRAQILNWYSQTGGARLRNIGASAPNAFGVRDMHGLVWEWVEDFASLMVSVDNREQGDPDSLRFCGAGALSMNDRENYAVLMRVAMLSSLQARSTTRNMGFRCAAPHQRNKR